MIRFFDIFFSISGIILLSPLLIIISIWIKIDSKGSVIYKQKRVGKDGKDFVLIKFRSMYIDSDKNGSITIGNRNPNITHSGYFIRKYKLDELPQLINVLRGDMSLVGPRPELRRYVDLFSEEYKTVLSIRPGITDYASIKFADENEL
ncbi:sugar transferase, partial [Bacteroidota bacterium]